MSTLYRIRMKTPELKIISLCMALMTLAPMHAEAPDESAKDADDVVPVYLVNSAFHTGFIMETKYIPGGLIPALKDLGPYQYADIGWGQEEYYQNPEFTVTKAARALLVPSTSVIRIEGFNVSIEDVVHWSDQGIRIDMDRASFIRLCVFIRDAFTRGEDGGPVIASKSAGGAVLFYKSNGTYHLFNTCNTWIAHGLKRAGYPISPVGVYTAHELFRRARRFGVEMK